MPFIADCYEDCYEDPTNRPECSRTSDDLRFGQGIFTQPIKEALGFSVVLNPPGTKMHKIHPLHKELRTALNKSRTIRASQEELVASLKGINAHHTMKKLKNLKDRPLTVKVQARSLSRAPFIFRKASNM